VIFFPVDGSSRQKGSGVTKIDDVPGIGAKPVTWGTWRRKIVPTAIVNRDLETLGGPGLRKGEVVEVERTDNSFYLLKGGHFQGFCVHRQYLVLKRKAREKHEVPHHDFSGTGS
jgi:hypothetical protein